ncbi:MAG: prepilin-type N-terminal cleavage/methylation domain-containing protein [bacterium]
MRKVKLHGFTLIELIVVIIISGIIVASSTSLLVQATKGYVTGRENINANWQAGLALERMTRDLHEALSITKATSNELAIINIYGADIDYKLEKNRLMRNKQVLADGIKNIAFNYHDANAIHYISISMEFIKVKSNFSTLVALWNVK